MGLVRVRFPDAALETDKGFLLVQEDEMTKVVVKNLTPHSLTVAGVTYPSEGFARVGEVVSPDTDFHGIPVAVVSQGSVTGLPDPQEGVILVVSRLTAGGVQGRDDIFFPHGEIRDEAGRILGVKRLARF